MRIAFVANPALGHVLPLLPLAVAAREAGHEVVVATGRSCRAAIRASGLQHVTTPSPDFASVFARLPVRAGLSGPRLAVATWTTAFAGVLAEEMAAAIVRINSDWRLDLVVHEDSEQGSWIGAEWLGIPYVTLQATAWRGVMQRLSREPLNRLRALYGLPDDPQLARWHRYRFLTTRPPALHDPADPMPATTRPIRPDAADEVVAPVPDWVADKRRPRVVVTMGTMPVATGAVLPWITAAFAGLDAEVVLTLGPATDPAIVEGHPENVRVVPYVPMSRILPTADAVVFHAGSGTMLAALAAGVPMVLVPVAADQWDNAERCTAAGVAVVVEREDRDAAAVRRALETVLGDSPHRAAADAVREEVERMPAPASVVPDLERIVADASRRR